MPTDKEKRLTVNLSSAEWLRIEKRLKGETFSNYVRGLLKLAPLKRGRPRDDKMAERRRNDKADG